MSKNFFLRKHTKPLIIAHRGASGDAPENTMASFRLAIEQGADAIELDTQRTKDGRLIVMHDPILGRTSSGRGRISRRTRHSLSDIDAGSWFDERFKSERIPSLGQVLDSFGKSTHYVVELKFYQHDKSGFARQVYEMVAQRGLLDHVMFLSFSAKILDAIKSRDPRAVTCLAIVPHSPFARYKAASRHDVIAASLASHRLHKRIARRGQIVNGWVGRAKQLPDGASRIDMITTNWPAIVRDSLD